MHFREEASALLEKMRSDYSDSDCWMLGFDDDDGASGYFEHEYRLRVALQKYVDSFEA